MIYKRISFFLGLILFFFFNTLKAQTWQAVGPDDTNQASNTTANDVNITLNESIPYVIFSDFKNGGKATLKKYNGDSWEAVGVAGFSAGEAKYTNLAFDGSTPYVVYRDVANAGGKITVQKYNGVSWEIVGSPGFSAGTVSYTSIAISGSVPYVVYTDEVNGNKVTVKKFNGTNWETFGLDGFGTNVSYTKIVFNGSIPYISFCDFDGIAVTKPTVQKHNGTSWETLNMPTTGYSGSSYLTLAFDESTPYIAYSGISSKAVVQKYNGTTWEFVGTEGFTIGSAFYINLAINQSIPYIVYQDGSNGNKATVQKYNGTSWVHVGNTALSSFTAKYTNIAFSANTPYVVCNDSGNGNKATIKKYNSSSNDWELVDGTGFQGTAANLRPILNESMPYVAYSDGSNGSKATIKRYNGSVWELVGSAVSSGTATSIKIKFDGNTPHVVYVDASDGNKATLKKYNSSSNIWDAVGLPISAGASTGTDLVFNNNTPYVAYSDGTNGSRAIVKKYNGSAWETVGSVISSGSASAINIAFNGNIPYVAYLDGTNGNKAIVKKYDSVTSVWITVGSGEIISSISSLEFAIAESIPYLAYSDPADGYRPSVKKFNSISDTWVFVGTPGLDVGFTTTFNLGLSLVFSGSTPYIGYQDLGYYARATVKKYDGTNWVPVGTAGFSAGTARPLIAANQDGLLAVYNYGGSVYAKSYSLGTLPVKLTLFKVAIKHQKQAKLFWKTASETNNAYFTVEKSKDGKIFERLINIPSKEKGAEYETIDYSPFSGTTYYKLSQTDKDGKTEELGIKSVKMVSLNTKSLVVYPNPVVNGIINLSSENLDGQESVLIYNLSGKVELRNQVTFSNGHATFKINKSLTKGIYMISVTNKIKAKIIID